MPGGKRPQSTLPFPDNSYVYNFPVKQNNQFNPPNTFARRDEDRLHSFVVSWVYELPFGPEGRWLRDGVLSHVLGNWQVSGFFTAQSGLPINFVTSNATLRAPGNQQRPNASGTPNVLGGIGPGNLWFDTSVFSAPAQNTWGNVGRNELLDGPAYVSVDASLAKRFRLPRGISGDFRIDVFNLFNNPKFNNPSGDFTSPNFGQITGVVAAASGRCGSG